MADLLSRTVEHNRYVLHESALYRTKLKFDFDLYGSSLRSLAPAYCTNLSYRARRLRDCPPAPSVSIAVPPWNQALSLLSEAGADHANITGSILLVLPEWPAQPWWPLMLRLSRGKILHFGPKPWVSPGNKRPPYGAVAIWIG